MPDYFIKCFSQKKYRRLILYYIPNLCIIIFILITVFIELIPEKKLWQSKMIELRSENKTKASLKMKKSFKFYLSSEFLENL